MVISIVKINKHDREWLVLHFPLLPYELSSSKLIGKLDFDAAYDNKSGKIIIGEGARETKLFLSDTFEIEICLDKPDGNGWPKVYEVGGRHLQIAERNNVKTVDLHFYSDDNNCCLGIKYGDNRGLRIKRFLYDLVIPFFYRLSYTEKFGITASRRDLWGEYSHGEVGLTEYETDLFDIARQNPSWYRPCPCRSDRKYKNCHFNEVEFLKQRLNKLCFCGSRRKYKNCHFNKVKFLKTR